MSRENVEVVRSTEGDPLQEVEAAGQSQPGGSLARAGRPIPPTALGGPIRSAAPDCGSLLLPAGSRYQSLEGGTGALALAVATSQIDPAQRVVALVKG